MDCKAFRVYLATGCCPVEVAKDAVDWTVHDRRYHHGAFNPNTMSCESRAALEHGDLADVISAEHEASESFCRKKLNQSLIGVTRESVRKDIGQAIYNGLLNGDINEPDFSRAMAIAYAAAWFFDAYSRKVILLSDGRCAYFAPSAENQSRGNANSESWALYSIHAVTHGGKFVKKGKGYKGKPYRERIWSPEKVRNMKLVEDVILSEKCLVETKDKAPEKDSILFLGHDVEGKPMKVVTRLDEYGNIDADLTEVTVVMSAEVSKPNERNAERLMPLPNAVAEVVMHQKEHTHVEETDP